MKAAHRKNLSQKGLSPIIIIIVLAVIGVGAFVLYNNSKQTSTPTSTNNSANSQRTQTYPQAQDNSEKVEKVESNSYTFYYPKGYTKVDEKVVNQATIITYQSPNKTNDKEGMRFVIEPLYSRMETPSSEVCKEFLQFSLRRTKNVTIIDAKPVDYVKSHGCEFHYVDTSVEGRLIAHEKSLWFKEGDDIKTYTLSFFYLNTLYQQEKETIDFAIDKFALK